MHTTYNKFLLEKCFDNICNNLLILEKQEYLEDEKPRVVQWDMNDDRKNPDAPSKTVSWDIEPEKKQEYPEEKARVVQWDIENDQSVGKIKKDIKTLVSNIDQGDTSTAKEYFSSLVDRISKTKYKLALMGFLILTFAAILSPKDMKTVSNDVVKAEIETVISGDIKRETPTSINIKSLDSKAETSNEILIDDLVNKHRNKSYLELLEESEPERFAYAAMSRDQQDEYAKELLRSESPFLNKLAFRESSYRPWIRNNGNYVGLFQIGKYSITELRRGQSGMYPHKDRKGKVYMKQGKKAESLQGIDFSFDRNYFMSYPEKFMPEEQVEAINFLIERNEYYLRSVLNSSGTRLKRKYRDLTIGGKTSEITLSGLIAASHLVGATDLVAYIKGGGKLKDMPYDGNKKSADYYMRYFNNLSME